MRFRPSPPDGPQPALESPCAPLLPVPYMAKGVEWVFEIPSRVQKAIIHPWMFVMSRLKGADREQREQTGAPLQTLVRISPYGIEVTVQFR